MKGSIPGKEETKGIHKAILRRQGNLEKRIPALACALTGNRTSNPLVLRPTLNPLSYTSQDQLMDLSAAGIKRINYITHTKSNPEEQKTQALPSRMLLWDKCQPVN